MWGLRDQIIELEKDKATTIQYLKMLVEQHSSGQEITVEDIIHLIWLLEGNHE